MELVPLPLRGFSRDPVSGETLDLTIRRAGDTNGVIQQRTNVSLSDLPIVFTGIPPDSYEAYIESFIGAQPTGCGLVQYHDFTINNPAQVNFTNSPPVSPSCNTNTTGTKNNGSITITASGGTGSGYQYSKDGGITFQTGSTFNGLTANGYSIRIKDSNGCLSGTSTVTVTQPPDITLSSEQSGLIKTLNMN